MWLANLEVWARRFANSLGEPLWRKLAFLLYPGELEAVYTRDKLIHVLNSFPVLILEQQRASVRDSIV